MSVPPQKPAQNAIVAPQPLAVEEGAKVLMAGGNAIDAAVTCAFVQAIVDPHSCGIGGYACLNLYLAGSRQAVGIDAPTLAGAKATPEMWADKVIRPNPDGWGFFLQGQVNDIGYTSICTPGWVKGMAAIRLRPSRPSQVPFARLPIATSTTGGLRLALAASVWQPQERIMITALDDDAAAWKRLFKIASAVLATSVVLLAFAF